MKTGIAGAGRVGCSIGKYLKEHGASVAGYYSKSKESVEFAATFTDTVPFSSLKELVRASDIIFITTPDDEIRGVWEKIAEESIQGKIICHFSGSLSSVVFSGREQTGAFGCSVHPMYAFSSKETSYLKLNQAIFTMEGDREALDPVGNLLRAAGLRTCIIDPSKKIRYHAAASMVSNMMIGLYQMSTDMLVDCGFAEGEARLLVEPLVRGNIDKLLAASPEQALTGPIERNDVDTVRRHLEVLTEGEKRIYAGLAQQLVRIASRKNPDCDYRVLKELLRKSHEGDRA